MKTSLGCEVACADRCRRDDGKNQGRVSDAGQHKRLPMLVFPQREGRIQSAERAVPTRSRKFEGYEPSFSLIRADSRHVKKGDSYVGCHSSPAAPQSRTVQEAGEG